MTASLVPQRGFAIGSFAEVGDFRSGSSVANTVMSQLGWDGMLREGYVAPAPERNTGTDFSQTTIELSAISPTDPLYAQQWHFSRMGDIETIWKEDTGAGVKVGVYDSNIDVTHADLAANHDTSLRVEFGGVTATDDINPSSTDAQTHGTSVAGLISAALNGEGVVGVAYGSSFTGVAIFDETTNFFVNGTAAQQTGLAAVLGTLNFDVVNHSWGSQASYQTWQNLSDSSSFWSKNTNSWVSQAENGRDGLGTIVLKASGNDNRNANGSGENTIRQIIDVAAVSDLDQPASYSNHGANILVSGLGSEFASNGGLGIVTTDRTGTPGYNLRADKTGAQDYTDDFGGTSAATPIVAGVVSLMLDANEGLGWRDVRTSWQSRRPTPAALSGRPRRAPMKTATGR